MNDIPNDRLPIELVHEPDGRIVVSFPHGLCGEPHFTELSKFLANSMSMIGIGIPPEMRSLYPEIEEDPSRGYIYLEDYSFGKAFYEIYYQYHLDHTKYFWRPLSS